MSETLSAESDFYRGFRKGLVFLFLFIPSTPALAESQKAESISWKEEAWENFKSPVTTEARNPFLVGIGITATLLVFKQQVGLPLQEAVSTQKPLGAFSGVGNFAGQGYSNAMYILGMLGYGLSQADPEAKRNASSMLQATLYSSFVTTVLKYSVGAVRPDSSSKDTFPSGHATAAFALASYIGCRHSLPWGIAAYTLAALVGFSRINDNRHYLHDIVAGATIGGGYGLGICLADNKRATTKASKREVGWFAAPTDGGAVASFTFTY